ncbi:MAG: sigma-E processing peptidase SpoIIGA [Clostridiales bacterium]|nr:sigma-E processing peptidase SpoIIGA [Clostridiales bacterium]
MELNVYADVVFLINFAMDLLILLLAGKLAGRRAKLWRLALGALIMSASYCAITFVSSLHIFYHLLSTVIMLMIGIWTAYAPPNLVILFKLALFSYLSAFLIGGICMGLFYTSQFSDIIGIITNISVNFSVPVLIGSVGAFYILFRFGSRWLEARALKRQVCMVVRIFFEDRDLELNALVDTGNSLRDPLSHAPVIVAEFDSVKAFLPDSVKLLFYEKQENNLRNLLDSAHTDGFSGRLRMIPYESLGKQNGLLIGFRPDKVEITREKDTIALSEVVIGIYNRSLSRNGDYQGLLNPELIGF